jgi:uncharacterized protein (TIGR02246 family)
MKSFALCTILLAAAAPSLAVAGSETALTDAEAIQLVIDTGVKEWNEKDAVGFAMTWSAEGDLVTPMGEQARGRDAIATLMGRDFAAGFQTSTASATLKNLRFLKDDIAVADFDWDVVGMTGAGGSVLAPVKYHVTSVLKKNEGQWQEEAVRAFRYSQPETL